MQFMVTFSSQLTTSSPYTQSHFLPLHHQNTDATAHDITATCNHAYLGTQSMPFKTTNSSTSEKSWMPVIEYCDLYLSYSALSRPGGTSRVGRVQARPKIGDHV